MFRREFFQRFCFKKGSKGGESYGAGEETSPKEFKHTHASLLKTRVGESTREDQRHPDYYTQSLSRCRLKGHPPFTIIHECNPMLAFSHTLRRQSILGIGTSVEGTVSQVEHLFARRVQNPPWGPLKVSKIAAGCRLKDSIENGGGAQAEGVGGEGNLHPSGDQ